MTISSGVRPCSSGWRGSGRSGPARPAAPSRATPWWATSSPASRRRKWRLARAVGAEHGDPLAEVDLQVERPHQSGQLEPLADDRPHAGAAAAQAHRRSFCSRALLGRPGLLELAQPLSAAFSARGMPSLIVACLQHLAPARFEPRVLLVPAPPQLARAARCGPGGPRVRREAAAVRPAPRGLDGDDPVARRWASSSRSWRDEQDRLARLARPAPPAIACRGRRGSCPARRAAARRRRRAAGPRARAASARRPRACARPVAPRRTAPSASRQHLSQSTSAS